MTRKYVNAIESGKQIHKWFLGNQLDKYMLNDQA